MTTYFIHGWHGTLNAGDDAFAIVTNWGLRKYLYASKVVMESDNSHILCKKYNINTVQINSVYIPGIARLRRRYFLSKTRAFVLAGGSLFTGDSVIDLQKNPIIKTHKTIAIGVSLGPFVSSQHEKNTLSLLNKMAYIGFRDDYSYNWAKSNNVNVPYTNTFDLAVLLPQAVPAYSRERNESKTIGMSLLAFNSLRNKQSLNLDEDIEFIKVLAKVTYKVAKDHGFSIKLYSLCRHPAYNDDVMCKVFVDAIPSNSMIEIFQHNGDAYRTVMSMKQCSHIVSMRLHGSVFAYLNQTPLLLFDYHPKCREFAKTVGLDSRFCLDLKNFDIKYYQECLIALLQESQIKTSLPLDLAQDRALLNFKGYTDWN